MPVENSIPSSLSPLSLGAPGLFQAPVPLHLRLPLPRGHLLCYQQSSLSLTVPPQPVSNNRHCLWSTYYVPAVRRSHACLRSLREPCHTGTSLVSKWAWLQEASSCPFTRAPIADYFSPRYYYKQVQIRSGSSVWVPVGTILGRWGGSVLRWTKDYIFVFTNP